MTDLMTRRTLLRRSAAGAVVLSVGGLFTWRELLTDDPVEAESSDGATTSLGLTDNNTVAIGQPAPNFILPTLTGDPIDTADYRGKTLVLNFWASWCPPCRAEMPELQALHQERQATGDLVVLGINFLSQDTIEAAASFADEFQLTLPVVTGMPDASVAERYGVRGLPATFFIDRNGILRKTNLGPVFGDLLADGVAAADSA
ncbi:MAG: TlpA family protein disulfide reductase [Dehalococcoidia bacterium]|jgi:peroxiredoxin|nr:TlpA family protein disulfide reductase [Dehalococcoidia bacterium]